MLKRPDFSCWNTPLLVNTVIIVAPHFPPSNLAAVHRSRLFAQHLPEFGWEPTVVTVHPDYYTEDLDWNLVQLVPDDLHVERVPAVPDRWSPVSDIGVRGFAPLLRRLLDLVDQENPDFLYIPIPSHYAALLGPLVHHLRGVPYGLDYIDPWVQPQWHPGEAFFNKHWVSRKLADVLEPFAVRDASLITGVAEDYYSDVLERNPHLKTQAVTAAMPYGGEKTDHEAVARMDLEPYLFDAGDQQFHFVYAGALLPKAVDPLRRVLRAIADARETFQDVCFHFIGTGTSPSDPEGYNVRSHAEEFGLWGSIVDEHPPRIPYLDALIHQEAADAVFVLGSTEPHYTPSKVYQGVLAGKPILAVLHEASSACEVVRSTGAGQVLEFAGQTDLATIERTFADEMKLFRDFSTSFSPEHVDQDAFETYSARSVSETLADSLSEAVQRTGGS
jgi:glycosyltransferase involved in cell wall biosynthesis